LILRGDGGIGGGSTDWEKLTLQGNLEFLYTKDMSRAVKLQMNSATKFLNEEQSTLNWYNVESWMFWNLTADIRLQHPATKWAHELFINIGMAHTFI